MLSLFKVFMSKDVEKPLIETINSGYITQGKKVEHFEDLLKEYIGNQYLLTLNSATSGLTLALRLLKNKIPELDWPGFNENEDIVISSPLTCFATTCGILANQCNIKWCDVDLNTCNMCLEDLKKKLNKNTKVIYLVHWGGYPNDLDKLEEIKEYCLNKYGFKPMIVEDCAHSFGAKYKDLNIGNSNNISVFSLQAIKHLTTGDGGIICLPHKCLYDRAKLLRWYGIDREKRNKGTDFRLENDIIEWGYKYHMNDINATIGIFNLPHINDLLKKNRDNANFYNNKLKNIIGVKLMQIENFINSAYWLYTIKVKKKDEFIEFMKSKNIMVSQVHKRNDTNECVKEYKEELTKLDYLEKKIVCIPVGWWITFQDREYIVKCIKDFYNEYQNLDYKIRRLEIDDYHKDYLTLINSNVSLEDFKNYLDIKNNITLVVEYNSKIIGTGNLFINTSLRYNISKIGYIENIFVNEKYKDFGIGKKIINELVKLSNENKCFITKLICKEELCKYYKNLNFKEYQNSMCILKKNNFK